MARFVLKGQDELEGYNDPEFLTDGMDNEWNYGSYLVDTKTNTIVFHDCTEPEDASLDRHYRPLLTLLNEVANGA